MSVKYLTGVCLQKTNDKHSKRLLFSQIKWKLALPPILACLCYLNGLNGDFVHDDIFAIKKNHDVIGTTSLYDVFYNDFWGKAMSSNASHKSYRPITVLTFRLNYWMHGLQPVYFHAVNVFLHVVVTSLLVYTCLHVFLFSEKCSLVTGLLFAVHPIHTEAVIGIVGRADLMAALFFLLAFIFYNKAIDADDSQTSSPNSITSPLVLSISLLLASLAMFSKENGVTVLGVCIIHDVIAMLRKIQTRSLCRDAILKSVKRVITTIVFTLGLLLFRVWIMNGELPQFQPHDNPAAFQNDTLTRILTHSYIWTYNMWLLLAPANLCYDWQHDSIPLVESFSDARNIATLTASVTILFFSVHCLASLLKVQKIQVSNSDSVLYALVFLVVPFLPASNVFFTVGFVLAERVLYIPSIGFCMLIAIGTCRLEDKFRKYTRHVKCIVCCLLLLHCMKTWLQNYNWQARETLFRSGIAAMPHNAKMHYNYGNLLKDERRVGEAIRHYREAIRLTPSYASAHNNIGTLLDDGFEAEVHFREALNLQPSHQGAHINLGNLLINRGMHKEGLEYLYLAIDIDFRNPDALVSIASCLVELGNYTAAEAYIRTCLELNPDYQEAYLNLGNIMNKLERHKESARYYMKANELEPGNVVSLANAANAYQQLNDYTTAEKLLKEALAIEQDQEILEQLAMVYYGAGRTQDSLVVYQEMDISHKHNSSDTVVRYAKLIAREGDLEKADSVLDGALDQFPNDLEVLVTKALVKSNLKEHHAAVELLTTAISQTDSRSVQELEKMYFDRANNYKDMRQYTLAMVDFNEMLKLNPNHAEAHGNVGAIHHIDGNFDEARYHYNKALELNPNNSIVLENIVKLERKQNQRDRGVR